MKLGKHLICSSCIVNLTVQNKIKIKASIWELQVNKIQRLLADEYFKPLQYWKEASSML